jgi:GAF domain-containing protein
MSAVPLSNAGSRLLQSLRLAGQPAAFYAVLRDVLQETTGYVFATLFVIHRGETLRVFTTEDALYPVGVRKPMGSTPWGDLVIRQQKSFLATDLDGVRSAFFDHAKIESLGCGSAISVPIVYAGNCLGSLNLNHREHYYSAAHVAIVEALAPALIPVLLDSRQQLDRHD